jgi:hypothetical protein
MGLTPNKNNAAPVYLVNGSTGESNSRTSPSSVKLGGASSSIFGEVLTVPLTPVLQGDFIYGLNSELVESITQGGGGATVANQLYSVSSAAATSSMGLIRSHRMLRYRSGQGLEARFSGIFSAPVVGNSQIIGLSNGETTLAFGSIGTDTNWGIIRVAGNTREIQKLTIGTKSSNAQTAVVTLGGVAYNVDVTNGATTAATAYEIASASYTGSFPGWRAMALGSDVYFICLASGNQTGTFSVSFPTSGAGSFTEVTAGATGTTEFVAQSAWNIDRMDGSGVTSGVNPSGQNLTKTNINVFKIEAQYLGGGGILFSVENKETGEFLPVHLIKYANTYTATNMSNPSMYFTASSRNTTNNTAVTVKGASYFGAIQGIIRRIGAVERSYGVDAFTAGTTIAPVFTIRSSWIKGSRLNCAEIIPLTLSVANSGNQPYRVRIIENATLNNTASFAALDASSIADVDIAATTVAVGNGRIRWQGLVAQNTSRDIDLERFLITLEPGSTLTVAVLTAAATTSASLSLQWHEDQ